MTKQPLTREDVEREVREARRMAPDGYWMLSTPQVIAALLAMAECQHDPNTVLWPCPHCHGTGLDQARLARGMPKLKEGM